MGPKHASKSFYEILEDEIRDSLRAEVESEVRAKLASQNPQAEAEAREKTLTQAAAERLEGWLLSRMAPRQNTPAARRVANHYPPSPIKKTSDNATTSVTELKPNLKPDSAGNVTPAYVTVTSFADLCAVELLARHSHVQLTSTFSQTELKTAWRKAALNTHPDRMPQFNEHARTSANVLFRELCECFERLNLGFAIPAGQSANKKAA